MQNAGLAMNDSKPVRQAVDWEQLCSTDACEASLAASVSWPTFMFITASSANVSHKSSIFRPSADSVSCFELLRIAFQVFGVEATVQL